MNIAWLRDVDEVLGTHRQRQHCPLEVGVHRSSEDLLQDSREALMRQRSGAEQIAEPGNCRDQVLFVNFIGRSCSRELIRHVPHLGPDRPRM